MADQHHGASRRDAVQRLDDRRFGVGVDALGRFVQQQERSVGEHRSGERDAPLLSGGQPVPVLADRGVERDVERGRVGGCRDQSRGGERLTQPDVVGDRAAHQHRTLRHPGDAAQPGVAVDVGQVDTAHQHPTLVGRAQAEQQVDQCGLATAAGAAHPEHGSRLQQQVHPTRFRAQHPACPSVDHHALHADRDPGRVGRGHATDTDGRLRLQHGEDLGRGGEAFRGVVEAGTHGAQRQVDLRGEDEHDQAGPQVEVTLDQAQPHRHGDQRDREGGQQLQDERGEERHPQRLQGRAPVLLGQRAQARRLVGCPAERDQHVEARRRGRGSDGRARPGPATAAAWSVRCAGRRGS